MTRRTCPVPGCINEVPAGATAIFCVDHFFMLPEKETAWLFRWKTKTLRCDDPEEQRYMREQLDGYVGRAVRLIQVKEAALS
ncbi:hypothetical protein FQ775_01165 [Nitratireductor mangrovi]|uniref:Uncharacterized protein n=1 Tax=Nitratireductor mangrovi TaxID=2599600 RepID=A0A5B8KU24_9HYPH|nr:hypothetical protein [Nitratireductor mangrovi]QDY99091.1 hypothetical protein FQ775_01165 [Nitratireductor mangrovi]